MNKRNIFIFILALAVASSFRLVVPLVRQSATFDEPFKIASAYLLVKDGAFDYATWDPQIIFNPPLYKYLIALPLRLLDPEIPRPSPQMEMKGRPGYFANAFAFGYRFLHENRVPAQKLLIYSRVSSLALYIAGGILLFFLLKILFGAEPALIFMVLYFLCPNLAASAVLATNDIHAAVLAVVYTALLLLFMKKPGRLYTVLIAAAFTLGICTKVTFVLLAPLYAVALVLMFRHKKVTPRQAAIFTAYAAITCALLLEIIFQFLEPAAIIGMFNSAMHITGIKLLYYALGKYSFEGFSYYFPLAFLLKTPLPVLALLGYSLYLIYREKAYKEDAVIIIFAGILTFLITGINSRLNAGLRYILPVYPLSFMLIAAAMRYKPKMRLELAGSLLAALLVSNFLVHPHYQSYFNVLIGKNDNAYKYLVDSSLDWGENVGDLAKYLNETGSPELLLSYFGSADPASYGITYQDLGCDGLDLAQDDKRFMHVNSDNPAKEYWAVSATSLVGLNYPDHNWFAFLKDREPVKVIGSNIFIYDITGNAAIHRSIAGVYLQMGRMAQFLREGRTILARAPGDTLGMLCLSISEYGRDKAKAADILKGTALTPATLVADNALPMNAAMTYTGIMVQNKDFKSAHALITRLLDAKISPYETRLYNLNGVAYLREKDLPKAKENFEKAINNEPTYPVSYYNLGLVSEKSGNLEQSVGLYRKALAYNPKFVPALRKLRALQQQYSKNHPAPQRPEGSAIAPDSEMLQ